MRFSLIWHFILKFLLQKQSLSEFLVTFDRWIRNLVRERNIGFMFFLNGISPWNKTPQIHSYQNENLFKTEPDIHLQLSENVTKEYYHRFHIKLSQFQCKFCCKTNVLIYCILKNFYVWPNLTIPYVFIVTENKLIIIIIFFK